jgi:hypothetical protein
MSFRRYEQLRVRPWLLAALSLMATFALTPTPHAQSTKTAQKRAVADGTETRDRLVSLDLGSKDPPALPADAVVDKMMETSARRSAELHGYRTTRTYHLQYRSFLGARDAGMRVVSTYTAPDKLDFSVISESGSRLLLNRVLLKLLDSERDAFRNQSQIELTPTNYRFDPKGIDHVSDADPCYVLGVEPRKESRFLYRGKVWIDALDFALSRMEGQPAKSPSFWIKDTQIDSRWGKVDGFWLIQHTRSVSHIRLGGMATLTIDYTNYQITGGSAPGHGQHPQLPDPSSVTPQR